MMKGKFEEIRFMQAGNIPLMQPIVDAGDGNRAGCLSAKQEIEIYISVLAGKESVGPIL